MLLRNCVIVDTSKKCVKGEHIMLKGKKVQIDKRIVISSRKISGEIEVNYVNKEGKCNE